MYYKCLPPLCLTYLTEQDVKIFFHDKNGKTYAPKILISKYLPNVTLFYHNQFKQVGFESE